MARVVLRQFVVPLPVPVSTGQATQ